MRTATEISCILSPCTYCPKNKYNLNFLPSRILFGVASHLASFELLSSQKLLPLHIEKAQYTCFCAFWIIILVSDLSLLIPYRATTRAALTDYHKYSARGSKPCEHTSSLPDTPTSKSATLFLSFILRSHIDRHGFQNGR